MSFPFFISGALAKAPQQCLMLSYNGAVLSLLLVAHLKITAKGDILPVFYEETPQIAFNCDKDGAVLLFSFSGTL